MLILCILIAQYFPHDFNILNPISIHLLFESSLFCLFLNFQHIDGLILLLCDEKLLISKIWGVFLFSSKLQFSVDSQFILNPSFQFLFALESSLVMYTGHYFFVSTIFKIIFLHFCCLFGQQLLLLYLFFYFQFMMKLKARIVAELQRMKVLTKNFKVYISIAASFQSIRQEMLIFNVELLLIVNKELEQLSRAYDPCFRFVQQLKNYIGLNCLQLFPPDIEYSTASNIHRYELYEFAFDITRCLIIFIPLFQIFLQRRRYELIEEVLIQNEAATPVIKLLEKIIELAIIQCYFILKVQPH